MIYNYVLLYYLYTEAEGCQRPTTPQYAVVVPDSRFYDDETFISYGCTDGRAISQGSLARQCVNGTWTGTVPKCIGKYHASSYCVMIQNVYYATFRNISDILYSH